MLTYTRNDTKLYLMMRFQCQRYEMCGIITPTFILTGSDNTCLSDIRKSELTHKIKPQFFPTSSRVDTAIWMHYTDAKKTYGEIA